MSGGDFQPLCRTMRIVLIILLTFRLFDVLTFASDLSPQQQRAVLEEAQRSYEAGMGAVRSEPGAAREAFRNSAARFQLVADSLDEGAANGYLLYNLANAHLQAGNVGRAILNYRRAQQLIPGDPRLEHNLNHARTLCRTQIASIGTRDLMSALLGWHDRLQTRWRFLVFAALNAGLWLTAIAAIRSRAARRLLIALALLWLPAGASVASDVLGLAGRPQGVLVADDVIVRRGNSIGFERKFEQPLHAGTEFTLVQRRGDWLLIQLANGDDGWVESKAAELVR